MPKPSNWSLQMSTKRAILMTAQSDILFLQFTDRLVRVTRLSVRLNFTFTWALVSPGKG